MLPIGVNYSSPTARRSRTRGNLGHSQAADFTASPVPERSGVDTNSFSERSRERSAFSPSVRDSYGGVKGEETFYATPPRRPAPADSESSSSSDEDEAAAARNTMLGSPVSATAERSKLRASPSPRRPSYSRSPTNEKASEI